MSADRSDVYGPLDSCSNCKKTKKNCTFQWLRSQRVLQASQPQVDVPPAKRRRRTRSNSSAGPQKRNEPCRTAVDVKRNDPPGAESHDLTSGTDVVGLGVTFGDFPCGGPMFAIDPAMAVLEASPAFWEIDAQGELDHVDSLSEDDLASLDRDSGKGSSLGTLSQVSDDKLKHDSPIASHEASGDCAAALIKPESVIACNNRKRRCRSPSTSNRNGAPPYPTISFASELFSSNNTARLTESLLKIYHDSFENALACWVTERTCPYSAKTDSLLTTNARPDWNRIYHRVTRLDRLASAIRGRKLTDNENVAASRALNLAVFSFASQWAQSSERSRTKYPFHSAPVDGEDGVFVAGDESHIPDGVDFDRTIQVTAWHEARNALQKAGEVESFRVVLAQIIFALTQKPMETEDKTQKYLSTIDSIEVENEATKDDTGHRDMENCEDLMSKLDMAIEADGPPVHLESGLRLIHSLRSRMAMCGGARRSGPRVSQSVRRRRSPGLHLEDSDRATVDLLFWLGVMFDTLSAAMHRRPLVVSDEDSDIVLNESVQTEQSVSTGAEPTLINSRDGLWDVYLVARQRQQLSAVPTRWPCSFDQAATALCDAAPVKVLLFRRVCRIQTLLARNSRGKKVEEAISAALEVCNLWKTLYAPFIRDCVENHDRLPPRVQSWYVCVTGHWHLATLLLADLMEIVDDSDLGMEEATKQRSASGFFAKFRETNCLVLSDLANCACPREEASFPQSRGFHFAVNEGALLTEPWTAVLIRAFAKAGVLLLESDALLPSSLDQEDAFRRADDCVKALWFLGRKSDMALSAARILSDALRQRRRSAQDKISDMSVFLEDELWHGLDSLDKAFEVDCEL
jgi:hypothetical protein